MARSYKSLTAHFENFKGIEPSSCATKKESLQEILNFHIRANGTLEKRCGYKILAKMPSTVRAMWSGMLNGSFTCIAVCGSSVYSVNTASGSTTKLCNISANKGNVSIFLFEGELYVKDILSVTRITSASSVGYIPLYGKDWGTSYFGEVYQPMNLMHRMVRISYVIPTSHTAMLPTKYPVESIYSLHRNGVLVDPSTYTFDQTFNTINVQNISTADRFVAVVTFAESVAEPLSDVFKESWKTAVFGGGTAQRLCVWGSLSAPHSMLTSTYVSPEELDEARSVFPNCNQLYFTRSSLLTTGNGRGELRAVISHYDRLLALTEYEAWMSDSVISEESKIGLMNINSSIGCYSSTGYTKVGDLPISVGKNGFYQWVSRSAGRDGFVAEKISVAPISDIAAATMQSYGVFFDPYNNELLFYSSKSGVGDVWVYSLSSQGWSKFTNIDATGFFDNGSAIGFYKGNLLFIFDSTMYLDVSATGASVPVEAIVTSNLLNLGDDRPKKPISFSLKADVPGYIIAIITNDVGNTVTEEFSNTTSDAHVILKKRLDIGRVSYVRVAIGSLDNKAATIHEFSVSAITPHKKA